MATRLIFGGGDSTPNAFTVTDYTGRSPGDVVTSSITPSGFDSATLFSVSYSGTGISLVEVSLDNVSFSSTLTGQIIPGQTLYVRITAVSTSNAFSTNNSYTVTFGYTGSQVSDTGTFNIRAADITPTAFSFTDSSGIELSTLTTSGTVTISGLEPNYTLLSVSCTGGEIDAGTSALSGTWATSKTVTVSATGTIVVAARATSSSNFLTAVNVVVTVGTGSDTYTITTRDVDRIGSATFTDLTNRSLNTTVSSGVVLISGLEPNRSFTFTASGDATALLAVDTYNSTPVTYATTQSATTDASGRINIILRVTTQNSFGTVSTVNVAIKDTLTDIAGSLTDSNWTATTIPEDDTANAFNFTDVSGVEPNTLTESVAIPITGVSASPNTLNLKVTGGEYYTTQFGWTGIQRDVSVDSNRQITGVKVRGTSSSSPSTTVGVTLTTNFTGTSDTFNITTRPANFSGAAFTNVTNAERSTSYDSAVITLTDAGYPNKSFTFNATNGTVAAATYNTTPTTFGASATATTDASGRVNVVLRATSSSSFSTGVTVTLSCTTGTVPDTSWTVTTRAPDLTGTATNPGNKTNQLFSALITSDTFTISGLEPNYTHTISVTGDAGAAVTVNGGTGTSRNVTSDANGEFPGTYLRITSSSSSNTTTSVTMSINGTVAFTWTVTTSPPGEVIYSSAGSYSFSMPANYSTVSWMGIGGGGGGGGGWTDGSTDAYSGGGGGGGGVGYKNNVSLGATVYVGSGGNGGTGGLGATNATNGASGGHTYISTGGGYYYAYLGIGGNKATSTAAGTGGAGRSYSGISVSGGTGGNGGNGNGSIVSGYAPGGGGGGGAAGYSGAGGAGATGTVGGGTSATGGNGAGGGSGGGGGGAASTGGAGGGGTGYGGQGTSGSGGTVNNGGGKGSTGGNSNGSNATGVNGANGGAFGGGGGGGSSLNSTPGNGGNGAAGASKIIWGTGVSFP